MIQFDKILLIDDENLCNYITSKILTKANIAHTILSFEDAQSGLNEIIQTVRTEPASLQSLVLLDINMPRMSGWGFLDAFEKLPSSVTGQYIIMMLSSSIDSRDIEKSKTYNSVKKFISKPFALDKILIS